MDYGKLKKSFEDHRFLTSYFETKEEAASYLKDKIRGERVGFGGSMTCQEMGLYEVLKENNQVVWHWKDEMTAAEARRAAMDSTVYILSANGVSETGELVNIDGMGNRVAAMCYGPRQVLVIAGMNKVLGTLDDAIARARNIAAPANAQRFGIKTPCGLTGQCGDCTSPDCICSYVVVTRYSMVHERIKVILVGEDLGL